jgi:hypothetical protein
MDEDILEAGWPNVRKSSTPNCDTIRRRHQVDVEDDARTPSPLPVQVVENTVV